MELELLLGLNGKIDKSQDVPQPKILTGARGVSGGHFVCGPWPSPSPAAWLPLPHRRRVSGVGESGKGFLPQRFLGFLLLAAAPLTFAAGQMVSALPPPPQARRSIRWGPRVLACL